MSQNSSIDQTVLEPTSDLTDPSTQADAVEESSTAIVPQSSEFSAELYADRLMDELFEDLEQSLERGTKLPTEPVKPDYIALQSLSIPKMALPSMLVPKQPEESEPDLDTLVAQTSDEISSQRSGFGKSFDKLLLAATGASLLVTGLLWLAFQSQWQQAETPQTVASAEAPQQQADREFLNYMQRSLEVIDREAQANQQIASAIARPGATSGTTPGATSAVPSIGAGAPNLPTVPVPANVLGGGAPSPVANAPALERVYIPVYQPPQASAPLASPASPTAPAAAPSSPAAATGAVPNIAPTANYVLVGVYESSDPSRSAALFEISGVTQRIYVGEGIGSSGWILVSVNNDEAIVRRNGEVRSIFAGQHF